MQLAIMSAGVLKRLLKAGGIILGVLVGLFLALTIWNTLANPPHGGIGDNSRRVSHLRQLQLALELWKDEHNDAGFPPAPNGCNDIKVLQDFLVPRYMSGLLHDYLVEKGWPDYQYAVSTDTKQYVLKAKHRDTKKREFLWKYEYDGLMLGCDCNDPNYCVGSL